MCFGEEDHRDEVPFSLLHIRGDVLSTRFNMNDVSLGYLIKGGLARCPYYNVTMFPFPYSVLWRQVTMANSHSKGSSRLSSPQEVEGGGG